MKVGNKKNNRDIKEQFITSILKMYHFLQLNNSLINGFYFLGLLQPLLFQNFYSSPLQLEKEQILTPINQFWYVEAISRPDILVENTFAIYGYLISFLSLLIFVLIPLLLNIQSKQIKHYKSKVQLYLSLASIFFQLLPLYFQIPLQSLCFKSLQINLIQNSISEYSYINICLSLTSSIMLFIFNFFILILCKESIDFQLNCFLVLKLNFTDFVIWNLSILQIIVYYFLNEINELLQAVILLIYSILLFANIFSLNTCLRKVIILTLFITSYQFIQSILIIINYSTNISIKINILLYIQVPLLCYIILQIFYRLDYKVCGNINQLSIRNIKYIFSKFFNDEFISYTQKIIMFTHIILLYSTKKQIEPQASLPLACINQEFMPKYLMSYFYRFQLKLYLKQLQKTDQKHRNANNYIHYASILYKLDQNNLSLKQINILLFNQNIYTHSRSFAKENQNDQIKSLNTIIQGGKSSVSKSSKSQEILEAGHHQINKTNKMLVAPGNHFLTFAQKVRIVILREKVKDKLKLTFQYREIAADTFNLQNAIEMFLKSERRNQSLKDQVYNLVNAKLQFYQQLQSVKHIQCTQLFEVAKQLSLKTIRLENKIIKLYKYFPSQRIQSLCTYFYGELIGNYLYAHKLTCNSSISDEKLLNVHNNQIEKFSFFNKDLVYLNVKLIEDTQELEIINMNQQSCSFFQRNFDDFKNNPSVDCLLPNGIKNEHQLLVQRFLQDSKSRFYLKKNLNFFKLHGEIIKSCEFFFDVDLSDNSQIQFLVFMNESYETSAFMLVDVNLQLGGFTKNFLDKLGYSDYYIENIQSRYLSNASIELIFPDFTDMINKKSSLHFTELKFLKQSILITNYLEDSSKNIRHDYSEWQNSNNILFCEALVQIHARDLFGFSYYIIEIKEIRTDITQKGFHDESNSLDKAFSSVSNQEAIVNSPCALQIEKKKFEAFSRNIFEIKQDFDKDQSFYQPFQEKYELNIMSPVDMSMTPAPLNSANPLLKLKQQEFYSYFGQSFDANSLSSKNQAQAIDMEDVDQIHKSKKQKEGDETNSSQYAGAKKSQFYKKYEMCQLTTRPFTPPQLKYFITLMIIQYIVCCIHFILIISKNQQDLNQFISEIDMIELHSSFMAPHDIFVAMRIAIISYSSYVYEGAINASQAVQLNQPFYDNIAIGYNEIKEVFIKQLTNENLQPFFENKTIKMMFMNANVSDVYYNTINIREALQQIIQNLFQYKYRYENRMSTANSSIQVFGVGNQFTLHYWLENLTQEILEYSKNRSILISSDLTIIWIIFLIISLLLIFGVLRYYRMYNQRYDKYLGVFKFCNQNKLSFEIERYKLIQKSLQKNSDQIFQYKFDLLQKEQQLLTQAKIQDAIHKRNKDQQKNLLLQYESLSIILGISLLFGIWAIFLGLSVIIFQGQIGYLNKYSDTVDIYKLIQDMTFSSATLYQNRDYHFIFKNFTYLTQFDDDQIFFLIEQGIQNIEKFNILCQNFEPSKYQVNDDFVNFFNIIQKNSVCETLGPKVMEFLTEFCEISIQGNFLNGIIAALNFVKNQIQTQITANNFTQRIEHPLYDNEAGIIMVRVFQLMTSKLKSSMLGVTNDLQTISVVLSTIYLIFSGISIIAIWFGFRKYLETEYNIVKRFIQLLPSSVTLLEDQFERYIRILLIDEIE